MNHIIRQFATDNGISENTSNINIDEILGENKRELLPTHLKGQTLESIHTDIYYSVAERFPQCDVEPIARKLADYRYIDELYQLQRGKHVRWIRISHFPTRLHSVASPANFDLPTSLPTENLVKTPLLTNGGIVVDIKIMDTGVHILCKNGSRYIQYKFDECLTYQKLSSDEMFILSAIKNIL